MDTSGGGERRDQPVVGASFDRWAYALDLLEQVQAARELRRQRGIGVPADELARRIQSQAVARPNGSKRPREP